jgi:hypothetical protein
MTRQRHWACLSEQLHKEGLNPFLSIGLSRYDATLGLGEGNETAQ